ncbi:MAG: murein biosynthesis integral membrane protein MurJ [Rhodospirillaceae bacterium]
MPLLRSIATVGGYTLLSRVFGFLRDILIARYLGAGVVSDAFFVAFRFPNLFRRLFAEGAFAAAFVPIFAGKLETEGENQARAFARQAFTLLGIILIGLLAIMEIIMPWAMLVMAPGFDAIPGKMELATELSRIAFPYLLFISLVSLQSGVLNALGHFAAAAAAPVLLNLTLIAALLGFASVGETPGHALAWGVSLAGVIQFLWLAHHCRKAGMSITPVRPRITQDVKTLGARILPVVLGSSLYQINLLIGTILASMVADGAVSWLYYGDRITQLPLGVIGVAVGTVLLPVLSRDLRAGREVEATQQQNRAIEFALLLTLPSAAALAVIAWPIVVVLFERGAFTPADSAATAAAMTAFALGLPAHVLVKVLAPGFFAREDTKTPVKIAAVALAANVVLNLVLMGPYGHLGIAAASSIAGWLNVVLLAIALRRRGHLSLDDRLVSRAPRILIAALGMGGAVLALDQGLLAPLTSDWHGGLLANIIALTALILSGMALYGGACLALKVSSPAELKATLRRRSAKPKDQDQDEA